MREIGVQGTKVICRNLSRFMPSINHIQSFNERSRVVNDPKTIVIFVKFTLQMKILDLVID